MILIKDRHTTTAFKTGEVLPVGTMILIKDRHFPTFIRNMVYKFMGTMILIKDRHSVLPLSFLLHWCIGNYDTYKGSTLIVKESLLKVKALGTMILIKDRHLTFGIAITVRVN